MVRQQPAATESVSAATLAIRSWLMTLCILFTLVSANKKDKTRSG